MSIVNIRRFRSKKGHCRRRVISSHLSHGHLEEPLEVELPQRPRQVDFRQPHRRLAERQVTGQQLNRELAVVERVAQFGLAHG